MKREMNKTDNLEIQENFTEREAALWLKISRATLQRARYRNEISYFRLGNNRIVYARRHLIDYCARREIINNLTAIELSGAKENVARQAAAGII